MDEILWLSLFTRSCGAILALQWRSDGHNLTIMLHLFEFNCDHPLKMKGQLNGPTQFQLYLYSLSLMKNVFLNVSSNRTQSKYLLIPSSFRLIFASNECLKSRIHWKNMIFHLLNFEYLFSKNAKWKAFDLTINLIILIMISSKIMCFPPPDLSFFIIRFLFQNLG